MREWLVGLVGESFATLAVVVISAGFVILLATVLILAARKLLGGTLATGTKSRAPRLALLDVAAIDPKRKLILVRRDEVEHLLLIGGDNDLVVESGILRVPAAAGLRVPEPGMRNDDEQGLSVAPARAPADNARGVPPVAAVAPRPNSAPDRAQAPTQDLPNPVPGKRNSAPPVASPQVAQRPAPQPQRRETTVEQAPPIRLEPRTVASGPTPVPAVAPPSRRPAPAETNPTQASPPARAPGQQPRQVAASQLPGRPDPASGRPGAASATRPAQSPSAGRPAEAAPPAPRPEPQRRPEPVRPHGAEETLVARPMTTPTYPSRPPVVKTPLGTNPANGAPLVSLGEPLPEVASAGPVRSSAVNNHNRPEATVELGETRRQVSPAREQSLRSEPVLDDYVAAPSVDPDDRLDAKPLSVRSFASVIQSRRAPEVPAVEPRRQEPDFAVPAAGRAAHGASASQEEMGLEELLSAELASSFGDAPSQIAEGSEAANPGGRRPHGDGSPEIAQPSQGPQPQPLTLEEEMERLLGDFTFDDPARDDRR